MGKGEHMSAYTSHAGQEAERDPAPQHPDCQRHAERWGHPRSRPPGARGPGNIRAPPTPELSLACHEAQQTVHGDQGGLAGGEGNVPGARSGRRRRAVRDGGGGGGPARQLHPPLGCSGVVTNFIILKGRLKKSRNEGRICRTHTHCPGNTAHLPRKLTVQSGTGCGSGFPDPHDCPSETLQRPEGKGGGGGTESPPLQLTPGNQRDQPRTRPGAHAGERPRARHPHVSCPQPRAGEGPLRP